MAAQIMWNWGTEGQGQVDAMTVLEGGLDTDSDMYFFPHRLPLLENNLEMPPWAILLFRPVLALSCPQTGKRGP